MSTAFALTNSPVVYSRLAVLLLSPLQELSRQPDLLRHVASSLSQGGQYEKAGELFEQAQELQQAMEAYRKARAYRRAVELARTAYPTQVSLPQSFLSMYLSQCNMYTN